MELTDTRAARCETPVKSTNSTALPQHVLAENALGLRLRHASLAIILSPPDTA